MSWNPEAPLSDNDWEMIRDETFVHARVYSVTFKPVRNKENNYMVDREQQRTSTMTGIHGFASQDQVPAQPVDTTTIQSVDPTILPVGNRSVRLSSIRT